MRFRRLLTTTCAFLAVLTFLAPSVEAHGRGSAPGRRAARTHTVRRALRSTAPARMPARMPARASTYAPAPHSSGGTVSGRHVVHPMVRRLRARATSTYQSGFSPQQVDGAYSLFGGPDGSGVTIAVVTAYDDPTAAKDFDTFATQFGLPTIAGGCGCFSKVNQAGGTKFQRSDGLWALEASLDIEWAHAMAPGATILLVEANNDDLATIVRGVDYATAHAQVVSGSWGEAEFSGEAAYDSHFDKAVAITVAAGDSGTPAEYPSASPYVLSVGGTNLTVNGTTADGGCDGQCGYGGETAWASSGGGASAYEKQPAYQTASCAASVCHGKRGTPDVAWVGSTSTGVAIYDSTPYSGGSGWWQVGGTSVGAPSVAGLIARVDSVRGTQTTNSLSARFVYQDYAGDAYQFAFHDITSGSNGKSCCTAGTGYDLASGLGSPIGTGWLGG